MIEIDLDRETLDCLGLRRADEERWVPYDRGAFMRSLPASPKATGETAILRIIKAVQAAGLEVIGVTVTKDGAIDVRTAKEEKHGDEFSNDEIIRRLRDGNRRQA